MTGEASGFLRLMLIASPVVVAVVGVVHSRRRTLLPLLVGGLACVGVGSRLVGWSAAGIWEGLHFVAALELQALLPLLMSLELWHLIRGTAPPGYRPWYAASLVGGVVGLWAAFSTVARGIP
jgi:hypothetical protein